MLPRPESFKVDVLDAASSSNNIPPRVAGPSGNKHAEHFGIARFGAQDEIKHDAIPRSLHTKIHERAEVMEATTRRN